MKTIMILVVVLSLCSYSFAQECRMVNKIDQKISGKNDCLVMKNGKMMIMKDSSTIVMETDMSMTNGTVVTTDGNVKMNNGKTIILKDGECVYMNGEIGTMKKP